MLVNEAKILLGFSTNSCPSPCQVKAAYRRKVWETHPDCFPVHLKPDAELKFKMISEAYTCLLSAGTSVVASLIHQHAQPNVGRLLLELLSMTKGAFRNLLLLMVIITGTRQEGQHGVGYSRVVRSGVPRGGRKNHPLIGIPFLFIILGTVTLGGTNVARAYRKQRADCPSHNPFLP